MPVELHSWGENEKRYKFLVWTPADDERNIGGATMDVFSKNREHIDLVRELQHSRGMLRMAGHLFENKSGTFYAVLGSESLEREKILIDGMRGSISPIYHWLREIVEPLINKEIASKKNSKKE